MPAVRRLLRADPDAVWAVIADPTTYPEWLVGAQVIRSVDSGFPAPGTGFDHAVGPSEQVALPDRTEAVDVEPGRSLHLDVRARPFFEGAVTFRLSPAPGGTDLEMGEEPLGVLRLVKPLLSPFIRARNVKSLDRLARLLDADGDGG